MTKVELASAIASEAKLPEEDVEVFLKAFTKVVADFLTKGEKVSLLGFGIFEVKVRQERKGRNPRTSEAIIIPETCVPVFKAGKALKDAVASVHKATNN